VSSVRSYVCPFCETARDTQEDDCCPEAQVVALESRQNVLERALRQIADTHHLRRLSDARRLANAALKGN
jgi:hypothetical protein